MKHEYGPAKTADGEPYSDQAHYYFFDPERGDVFSSQHLRRMDQDHIGSLGLRVIAISLLRRDKNDAFADGQAHFLAQIHELRERVENFEVAKDPKARSLKNVLLAGR